MTTHARALTAHLEWSVDQVFEREGDLRIVDVREPHEFVGELGHIRDAELVPLGALERAADRWDPAQPIVLVCRSGGRSGRAAALLSARGFARVINMTGGMLAWNARSLPVERVVEAAAVR